MAFTRFAGQSFGGLTAVFRKHTQCGMPFCSWCLNDVDAQIAVASVLTRNLFRCPYCHRTVVECRFCENYACWDSFTVALPDRTAKRIEQHNQCCAEHRHDVRNFHTQNLGIESPDQYRKIYDFRVNNMARAGTTALVTLGGMAIAGPLACVAGPAIGGAIGTAMGLSGAAATSAGLAFVGGGSLAVGGLGMAGGLAIVTMAGSAIGGSLGAYVAGRYLSDVEDFEIYKVRSGRKPAVITINGFLTQRTDAHEGWLSGINRSYPDHEWFHLEWESKNLSKLGLICTMGGGTEAIRTILYRAAAQASKEAAKKINGVANVAQLIALSTNPWHVAMNKAEKVGVVLTDILSRCGTEQFILIGHSLGCRAIYSCMQTLATTGKAPRITGLHLLGGAVHNDRANWVEASKALVPTGRICNYFSNADSILRVLYSAGTFFRSSPIGRNRISRIRRISNHDMSARKLGHMDYKPRLHEFLLPR